MASLKGKAVFITGASSGIGAALAREFATQGARVALAARRVDRLRAVREAIETNGGEAVAAPCDVTRRDELDGAVAEAVARFGGLDIVVANAGFGVTGPVERLSLAEYRRQFDVNFFGLVDTLYAALPALEASRGCFAVVSSVLGRVPSPAYSAYVASKHAVTGFAESVRFDLHHRGVAVALLEPGVVTSEFRHVDNAGQYQPRGEDPAGWLSVPTGRAARAMVRAIRRRAPETVITGHGKAIVWAYRHFPWVVRRAARFATRKGTDAIERRRRP